MGHERTTRAGGANVKISAPRNKGISQEWKREIAAWNRARDMSKVSEMEKVTELAFAQEEKEKSMILI